MFSSSPKEEPPLLTVSDGLKKLYNAALLPLEQEFLYPTFYSPLLTPGDFASKPSILLLGQYSTGKTTFTSNLLETEYVGSRVGPEPTTDRFVAVMHGDKPQQILGNAAVADRSRPFQRLSDFGNTFLERFEIVLMPSPLLQGVTIIDTPGVLAGNKQRSRGYDFEGVISWFAERVDLIFLMFDAHKLDISDEFKRCIQAIRGSDTKVRIILNKADAVSQQQLMRVYGALMWSLGKVMPTPEVPRVYIGSFWDKPLQNEIHRELFEAEASDLLSDVAALPRNAAMRKLNDFVKRARLLRAHVRLMDYLQDEMPSLFGKSSKQKELIASMPSVYHAVCNKYNIPMGDLPPMQHFLDKVKENELEFHKFPSLKKDDIAKLERTIDIHIPALMQLLPKEEERVKQAQEARINASNLVSSPFLNLKTGRHPPELMNALTNRPDVRKFSDEFNSLPLEDGKVSGVNCKQVLMASSLPSSVLHRLWNLADTPSKDGYLDLYEFALAKTFIRMKLDGFELPADLPKELYPEGVVPPASAQPAEFLANLMGTNRSINTPNVFNNNNKQHQPQQQQQQSYQNDFHKQSSADSQGHSAFNHGGLGTMSVVQSIPEESAFPLGDP